jgi:hypothetical protein
VPNEYTLYLSPPDRSQFAAYEGSLIGELQEYLGEHARREGYALLTAPSVLLQTDADLAMGEFGIATRVVQREEPAPAAAPDAPAPLPTPPLEAEPPPAEPPLPAAPPAPPAPAATMIYRPETPLDELEEDAAPPPVQRETVTLTVDGRVVPITSSRVVVGRSRECDVRVDDGNVSRRHCEVAQESPTAWVVADLGSTNGTEVNGRKVSRRTRLDDGDRITVGGTELVFGRTVQ